MLFIATLLDSENNVDIYADGSQITITDNSNYVGLEGTAIGGGASTITLDADASSINDTYNNCSIKIVDGAGVGQVREISNYVGSSKVATVSLAWATQPDTTSVYNISEAGHLQSDFSEFRKISILDPDDDEYLFSSIGDGDATIDVPSDVTLPIVTVKDYDNGDGKYVITLYSLPTYRSTANYKIADYPYVYYNDVAYKLLKDGSNKQPDIETDYWEVVSDTTQLSTKYKTQNTVVFLCNTKQCYAQKVVEAVSLLNSTNVGYCNITEWKQANELMLILDTMQGLVNANDWATIENNINYAKTICDCCCE